MHTTSRMVNIAGRLMPGLAVGQPGDLSPGVSLIVTGDHTQVRIMAEDVHSATGRKGTSVHKWKQASLLPALTMVIAGEDPSLPGVFPFTPKPLGACQIDHARTTLVHRRHEAAARETDDPR